MRYLDELHSGRETVIVAVVAIVITLLSSVLRTWSRSIQKTGFMWSDLWMPLSLFFNLVLCIATLLVYLLPMTLGDDHQFYLRNRALNLTGPSMYIGAVTFPKLAILDIYLHIFVTRISRCTTWIVLVVLVLAFFVNQIAIFASCSNLYSCRDDFNLLITLLSVPNIITDIIMLPLPMPTVYRLHKSLKSKIGITVSFLIGSAGLVTAVVRLVETHALSESAGGLAGQPYQTLGAGTKLLWMVVEAGTYHLCACSLSLRPLVKRLFSGRETPTLLSRDIPLPSQRHAAKHRIPGIDSKGQRSDSSDIILCTPPTENIERGSIYESSIEGILSHPGNVYNRSWAISGAGAGSGSVEQVGQVVHVKRTIEVSNTSI